MTVGCLRLFFQTHRTCIRSHSPRIRTSQAILGLNIYQQRARSYMLANMLVLFLRKDLLVLERLRCWLFQPIHFPRRRNSEAPNDVSHVPTLFTCEVSTPRHVCLAQISAAEKKYVPLGGVFSGFISPLFFLFLPCRHCRNFSFRQLLLPDRHDALIIIALLDRISPVVLPAGQHGRDRRNASAFLCPADNDAEWGG